MAAHRRRGRSARWAPTPRSRCCPSRPRLLFDYFTQLFAQVTNPPLDAIREELVTSLGSSIGPEGNVLDATPAHARQLVLPFPVIDNDELAKIVHINADGDLPGYSTVVVKGLYDVTRRRATALRARLHEIFAEVVGRDRRRRPLRRALRPRLRPRPRADPVAAADLRRAPPPDPREDPHPGRSASSRPATCARCTTSRCSSATARRRSTRTWPWRPSRTWCGTAPSPRSPPEKAVANLIKALGKGVLKVMSKMGISTVASYRGAQVFEAIGLSQELVDEYFTGTRQPARRHRPRRHRRRGRGPARGRLPARRHPAGAPQAAGRRRVPVAPRGRAAPVRPRDGLPAAARHPGPPLRRLQAVHLAGRRAVRRG